DALALTLPPSASSSLPCAGGGAAHRRRGQPPLRQALLPSGGTLRAGGHTSRGRCPCWRPLLPAATLAGDNPGRGAAPCGLVAGSRHLRSGRGWLPLAVALRAAGPCGLAFPCRGPGRSRPPLCRGALAATDRPCKGAGCGHARLPLVRASFVAKIQQECVERFYAIQSHHTPSKTNLLHENLGSITTIGKPTTRRSYIPVFQFRMEKMKEVKRPLWRYPHDGSLQRNSSNLILQLLLRGREENRRWWLKGAIGLGMASLGVTLVLRTSWFNRSSWIRKKKIVAIRVYGCRAFTSP
ncbi:hypothetical protein GW17_00060128, partial [Ensete ventricosum]